MKKYLLAIPVVLSATFTVAQTESYTLDKGSGYAKLKLYSDGDGTNNNAQIKVWTYGSGGSSNLNFENPNWGGGYFFRRGASGGTFSQVRIIHGGGGSNGYQTGYGILDAYGPNETIGARVNGGGDSYFLNGNVGIGLSDPQSNLAVNKDLSFGSYKTALPARLAVYDASTDPLIPAIISGSTGGTLLESSGYGQFVVGVRDNDHKDGFHVISTSQTYSGQQNGVSAPYNKVVASFLSRGDVGIGTNDPKSMLQVHEDIAYGSYKTGLPARLAVYDNSTNPEITSLIAGSTGGVLQENSGYGQFVVGIRDNDKRDGFHIISTSQSYSGQENGVPAPYNSVIASFLADGKVGIGTNDPDSKLTVAGNIHSREVKVTVDAGADFVFEESYELRPLEELENFVIHNKHLPEIQSEDQMLNEGLQVGEMSIKLLQKVEELTLYVIEQNKLNQAQQKLILEQQLEIEALKKVLLSGE